VKLFLPALQVSLCLTYSQDDRTLRLWSSAGETPLRTEYLSNPGVKVQFHPRKQGYLLLAEVSGELKLYNYETFEFVMSFRVSTGISTFDWSLSSPFRVALLTPTECILWKFSENYAKFEVVGRASSPRSKKIRYSYFQFIVSWSSDSSNVAIVSSTPGKSKLKSNAGAGKVSNQIISPIYIHKSSYPSHFSYELVPSVSFGLFSFCDVSWHANDTNVLVGISGNALYTWKLSGN
jgi:hypothetical protein